MRCEVMHVVPGAPTVPTGWHYHTADVQFLYILKGWVDMEIDGIGKVRLSEHDSVLIPGGTVHQELRASDEMQLLEVSLPGPLGTVNCGPPASN
jgi:quercetin dioxygenase-like cupin family protein